MSDGDVALNFIVYARQLATSHSFTKAFNMYLYAFDREPRLVTKFEAEFRAVLSRINEKLAAADNKADIFANFEKAVRFLSRNVQLLNDIGRYLYRYGFFSEALCHFEKALNIDHSFVIIEKNLNNAKSFLFPRCRFRLLNDKIHNDAYRRAIRSSVTPAVDSVLNIDTGTGLLALYANECNPITITACELSTSLAKLAECVMQENDAQEVVIINKPSVVLNCDDIYGTRSVLITDMIDSAIFGEHILQSVCHAWEYLLQDNSKVIPGRAEYFVAGIRSEQINQKYKLTFEVKDILNVTNLNVHTTTYFGETYYSEDVNLHEDVTYMSEPQSLLKVDFNNYDDVREKLYSQESCVANLTATRDGEMNMVIGWFNLHLTEDIMITSDPRSEVKANAWQQSVFFDVLPKTVRKGDTTTISFVTYGGKLSTLPETNTTIMRISPEALAFLNDFEYMDMIRKSMGTVCVHLGQSVSITSVDMVDLSPFPMFGVLMMKRGANSLICHVKTVNDEAFLLEVLKANDIPEEKVTILVADSWSHKVFNEKQFHVIFSNIIEFNGDLDPRTKNTIEHLKRSHLVPGGLCLPVSVTLMGQLINSEWVDVNNRVQDDNVDYRLAKLVNRYQVSQALYIDIGRMEYDTLSEQFSVSCCSNMMKSEVINVDVTVDGECNAVLCWYKLRLLDEWDEICTNRSNSFVQSMAFMASPKLNLFRGDQANVYHCVDPDGSFRLVLDVEPY